MPTLDRPESLAATLAALAALDVGHDLFEVIVVDDGGRRPVREEAVRPRVPFRLRVVRIEHAGSGAARNAGARLARGRFLCFTDHDCQPVPDWLSRLKEVFETHPEAAVGGRTEYAVSSRGDAASAATVEAVFRYFTRGGREPESLPTCNLAFPAEAFREIGGFHPEFPFAAEDRELCDRWRASGRRLHYAPEAVVRHAHGLSLPGFFRQQFHYGQGALLFARLRTRAAARPLPPDWRFYAFLLRFPMRAGWSWRAFENFLAVAAGRGAYWTGFFVEAARRSIDRGPRAGA